jgi:AmiR/NasT family two-component response regulator
VAHSSSWIANARFTAFSIRARVRWASRRGVTAIVVRTSARSHLARAR